MKVDYRTGDGFPTEMGDYLTKDSNGIERILFFDGMGFALVTELNHYIEIVEWTRIKE